jgi:hypothetical protein
MILTHLVFFQFFPGAGNAADLPILVAYSKIHQGMGLAF